MNDCRSVVTPIDPNNKLSKDGQGFGCNLKTKYQQIVGSLHYSGLPVLDLISRYQPVFWLN